MTRSKIRPTTKLTTTGTVILCLSGLPAWEFFWNKGGTLALALYFAALIIGTALIAIDREA
jgi:hypothetical protein